MKRTMGWMFALLICTLLLLPINPAAAQTSKAATGESTITLSVLNPQGPVKKSRELAPRLETLKGKTVAMWLSATRGQTYAGKGAELYDLLAKMLQQKYEGIRIIPYMALPMKFAPESEVIDAIAKMNPDAVIAGFGG